MTLRVGTRASPLARIQANAVIQRLRAGGIEAEAVPMSTRGDRSLGGDLSTHVGQFVTGLDAHLFNDNVDLTVHSSKDVPIDLNESVIQVALLERAPAFDLLLFPAQHEHLPSLEETLRDAETKVDAGDAFSHLAEGAHVGTVSVRRQASLLHQPSGCLAHRDSRRDRHPHATAQRRACRRAAAGRSGVAPSARPRCTRCGAPPTSGAQAEP